MRITVVIIDADYDEEQKTGHAAGVVAESMTDEKAVKTVTAMVEGIGDYIPGQFYKRELKIVEAVISQLELKDIDLIVVDGYADSGTEEHALGTYVYEKYNKPVIGIAKNKYPRCTIENTEVYRGESKKPLYVTSKGISHEEAKSLVKAMAGEYRIPLLVKYADKLARDRSC